MTAKHRASHLKLNNEDYISKLNGAILDSKTFKESETSILVQYARRLVENRMPVIFDEEHLSKLVGYDVKFLYSVANQPDKFYRTFYIKKRGGGLRQIDEPLPALRNILDWIKTEIAQKLTVSDAAKAYIHGRSIKDNARLHRRQQSVICLDIRDFFKNCTTHKIYVNLVTLGYTPKIAGLISHLVTLRGGLPMGSPASPGFANHQLLDFDNLMLSYAKSLGIRYSRYSDDLTFSGKFDSRDVKEKVKSALLLESFYLNSKKERTMHSNNRQIVTGVVVNEKLNVRRTERMSLRKETYYINKYGIDDHLDRSGITRSFYKEQLTARIGYALWINPHDQKLIEYKQLLNKYASHK